VRGWGLIQGLVLKPGAPSAPELVKAAIDHGLLLVPAGPNVVRFVPPLVIRPRELRQAVRRFEKVLLRKAKIPEGVGAAR
jgi:acetylornithine/N-succinyldiaminopimelate aminotransferase